MIQQFDDAEEPSQTSEEARSGGGVGPMWPSNERWQEEWFSHEDRKYDAEEEDEVIDHGGHASSHHRITARCSFANDLSKKMVIVGSYK